MISKLRAVDWKSRRVAFRAALVVVALLAVWAAVAYLIPDEPNDEPPESMFVLFDSSAYQRLIERLDKSNRTVIAGKQEDGLNVFLKYYLQQSGRSPIRHRSFQKGQLQPDTKPAGGFFTRMSDAFSDLWSNKAGGVWIFNNGKRELESIDLSVLNNVIERHPDDKFIVVSEPTYQQLEGFEVLNYQRPSQQSLTELLLKTGFDSQLMRKLVMKYSHDSYHQLARFLSQDSPKEEFASIFEPYGAKIKDTLQALGKKSGALSDLLKKLCKNGFVAASKEIKGIDSAKYIANFESDGYYWADYHYYFAYSIDNEECRFPEQISSYVAPPASQQPESTPEQPPLKSPVKSKRAKKSKKK